MNHESGHHRKPTRRIKTGKNQFTEETVLAFFARYLDGLKWQYHRAAARPALDSGYNGEGAVWNFNLTASETQPGLFLLGVNSFLPNKAPAALRPAIAEVLTRINAELSLGCFELDYPRGEIRFRTSVVLPGGDITPDIIQHLVQSNLCLMEERLPQIMAVLYGQATPEAALQPKAEPTGIKKTLRFELN